MADTPKQRAIVLEKWDEALNQVAQLQRDLAAARSALQSMGAEAARYRAALATVICVDDDEDRGVIVCGEEYDGHITRCVNCEARDVGEAP